MKAGTHWLGLSHLVYWSLSSEGLIRSVHVMSSLTHTLSKILRSDGVSFSIVLFVIATSAVCAHPRWRGRQLERA